MNKKNEKSNNKLGLNLFEANLQRHPSVKCLFDEDGKRKTSQKSNNELLLLNIDNKNEKEFNDINNGHGEEESYEKKKIKELEKDIEKMENEKRRKQNKPNKEKKEKRTMSVQINRVEEKMVDNKDTFFVEMNEEEKKEIIRKKIESQKKSSKFLIKPLKYGFNEVQNEFDKSITEAIIKGKDYNEIEKKFSDQLKKK